MLHRLFAPGSDRAAEKWKDHYAIEGTGELGLHQLYRAMAWLEPAVAAQTAPAATVNQTAVTQTPGTAAATPKPKFSQQQVASRLRGLKRLYTAGLLTDEFYLVKLAECQVLP